MLVGFNYIVIDVGIYYNLITIIIIYHIMIHYSILPGNTINNSRKTQ